MEEEKRRVNIFEETMAHMTYLQIEEAVREGTIVLFPIGVIEEHRKVVAEVIEAFLQGRYSPPKDSRT